MYLEGWDDENAKFSPVSGKKWDLEGRGGIVEGKACTFPTFPWIDSKLALVSNTLLESLLSAGRLGPRHEAWILRLLRKPNPNFTITASILRRAYDDFCLIFYYKSLILSVGHTANDNTSSSALCR